jgi:glucosylceramidase
MNRLGWRKECRREAGPGVGLSELGIELRIRCMLIFPLRLCLTAARRSWVACLWISLLLSASPLQGQPVVEWWSSSEDGVLRMTAQPDLRFLPGAPARGEGVTVDPAVTYQTILGLGSSLEHSTCYNLSLLPPERREEVMIRLLHPREGIGMNLMRVCIGTPDFTASPWYTYHDLEPGETDPEWTRFSIEKDREYVLPVLQMALRINPDLKFFASPWSPPAWMKTNGQLGGGAILPKYFPQLAEYFARFVEAYQQEGIEIHAITVQNEPEYNPTTYPTCAWTAEQQRDFIRDHLGPLFEARNLATRIWCFDHNFNNPEFPATLLRDPKAAAYIDGTAFHHYEGKPEAMSRLQRKFPDKHLYFTEGSTFGSEGAAQIISFLRNGSRSYNAWVTMIDHHRQPNPGPHPCSPTAVMLNSETLEVEYRHDYYIYGQFMKFIQRDAIRIASTEARNLPDNVVFLNPDSSIVLIAANPDRQPRRLPVTWGDAHFEVTLAPQSVATFRWQQ